MADAVPSGICTCEEALEPPASAVTRYSPGRTAVISAVIKTLARVGFEVDFPSALLSWQRNGWILISPSHALFRTSSSTRFQMPAVVPSCPCSMEVLPGLQSQCEKTPLIMRLWFGQTVP